MKVLIVSFLYPPFNSITGLGVSKTSRYLLEQGWDVRVLCGPQDDVPEELPVEIPVARVTRTSSFDVNAIPKMLLGRGHVVRRGFEFNERGGILTTLGHAYRNVVNFPDGQIGWYPHALKAGTRLIDQDRPDVILAFATPWTSHLIARALSRRFQIPWVARYHDLWTDSRARRRAWPLSGIERALEDRNTRSASAIATMADAWRDELAARFPSIPVSTVPFGFEPADYPPVEPPRGLPLSLLYTGRLYARQNPSKLFAAVSNLLASGRMRPADIRIRFVGRYLDVARRALVRFDLPPDVVQIDDPLPHKHVMALQQRASALVVFMGEDEDVGLLPAKMYEYMGARRPVLVIGGSERHEGVMLVRQARNGIWARGSDDVADTLTRWLEDLRSGSLTVEPDRAVIKVHEWASATALLGDVLRGAVERRPTEAG